MTRVNLGFETELRLVGWSIDNQMGKYWKQEAFFQWFCS